MPKATPAPVVPDAPPISPLAFETVTKTYVRSHLGRRTYSRGVGGLHFSLVEGEVFGLLGLNGQGKTTTMKLALGLLRPTVGRVRVYDRDPEDPEALAQMGYLPELPYFYPYLSPREALTFYARLSRVPSKGLGQRVKDALADVGLLAAADRKAREFSKGMLQRLGLAQAMLHRPKLYVLDEPASGLDPLAVHDIRELLASLNRQGATILLSSHSISEVEKLCHRVGILVEGRLARILGAADWADEGLEKLFIETVLPKDAGRRA
ncbi:MAG: ABC transporter ATP-binding protein [Elusimicrobiota bacterium]|jgi:ABC-2 type transport system ATP-binding protein